MNNEVCFRDNEEDINEVLEEKIARERIMPSDQFLENYSKTECLEVHQRVQYLAWQYSLPVDTIKEKCMDLLLPYEQEVKQESKIKIFVKKLFKR